MENERLLEDIFRAYYDARQHKRNTRSQLRFELNLERNLIALYHEIGQRRYKVGRSMCFITNIPVKREVFAADFRDRVVHHLLFNYIAPLFERTFIEDSYSCRYGKGTLFGIERLEHHIRSCSDNFRCRCYLLKLDIRGYFMNIDRQRLYDMVIATLDRFADRKTGRGGTWAEELDYGLVKYLVAEIIFNDPTRNCYINGRRDDWAGLPPSKSLFRTPEGCGLPIGNLTSQLFSNVYLSRLDDFVKRGLREPHYGRYVDDFFLVGRDRKHLLGLVPRIQAFLENELGLTLHPNKIYLQSVDRGVNFLGTVVKPYRRYLLDKTKRRINGQVDRLLSARQTDIRKLTATVNSYLGYMGHLNCHRFTEKLIARHDRFGELGAFSSGYGKFVPYDKK